MNLADGESFRRSIVQLSHRLRVEYVKLDQTIGEMKVYLRELYEKCVSASKLNQPLRARLYAEETGKVQNLMKQLLHVQLIIEHALIRLETLKELGRTLTLLHPIAEALRQAKTAVAPIIPETSRSIGRILSEIDSMVEELGVKQDEKEVEKIIEEAKAVAEEKARAILPEPPEEVVEAIKEAEPT